ncbi:MAG: putative nitrilotriacetate monooxygenase [Actinomycetia bacterium]|nr:putative nitrilotriacetate monooxygenase [Actinomycetes bacterium]
MPRQIRLNLNLQTAGRHNAAWKTLEHTERLGNDVGHHVQVARLAEKGKLDAVFLADGHGGPAEPRGDAVAQFPASELPLDEEPPYARLAAAPADTSLRARHREQLVTEARARGLTVRQLLFNNLGGGHRVLIGTPEQVADDIIEWVDGGASDGFNINIDVQTEGLEQFIDGVVAELQQRGRFRKDYEYQTFRENLGVA